MSAEQPWASLLCEKVTLVLLIGWTRQAFMLFPMLQCGSPARMTTLSTGLELVGMLLFPWC